MAQTPEREKPKVPEGVVEHPETVEIPPHIEKGGVAPSATHVTAQVSDDSGQPLIQTPASQKVTIQVPAAQDQLEDWSHGAPSSSLTWFAAFWLRLIKKALRFGWKVVGRETK